MLYVYIVNIWVPVRFSVRFGYFGYKNIGTIEVFVGFDPVPVSDILVWFRFDSSVLVFAQAYIEQNIIVEQVHAL